MGDDLRGKRCAIYARYSSDAQREASIEDQVRICQQYVERNHGTVEADRIFTDFAIRGGSMQRPGFEALLRLIEGRSPQIDVIVTENLARVSRDFADSGQLYRQLRFAGVRMINVSDGIDTGLNSSKLTFAIKAAVADSYRDDLADMTRRGLQGRVINGYSAGGLAFGYRTVPEKGADDRVVGYRPFVDEDAARVVRRVFHLCLEGHSHAAIARRFNTESVQPPRAKTRHRRKGWVASTVRAMLHNERYAGIWKFGEREWVRVPGTNKRTPRLRDRRDVIRVERPELRIVDPQVWVAVQERLAGVRARYTRNPDGSPKGRSIPGKATRYLLSGVLTCGECGSALTVTGTAPDSRTYRCSDHLKRGTCASRIAVREVAARETIVQGIVDELGSPAVVAYLRERIAQRLRELAAEQVTEGRKRRGRLDELEKQIANLVDYLAQGNASPAVAGKLRELEAEAVRERGLLAGMENASRLQSALPTDREILDRVLDLKDLLEGEPTTAREVLRAHLAGGQLKVTQTGRHEYVARGDLIPAEYLIASGTYKKVSSTSSGGWI
ncbi:MAG: recombinase family protein [Deltaproteobacteria bacterium]|nr:recombinase family protein [Deltaproteobacteria bacterium]